MFHHAYGRNLVESFAAFDKSVVLQFNGDFILQTKALDLVIGVSHLLLGQRYAITGHAIMLGSIAREGAPAAAHIKHMIAGLQAQFAAHHIQFLDLRCVEVVAPVVIMRAGVDHLLIQPQFVKGVRHIVVVGDVGFILGL